MYVARPERNSSSMIPNTPAHLNIDRFEIAEGFRLICSAFARTDVELDK